MVSTFPIASREVSLLNTMLTEWFSCAAWTETNGILLCANKRSPYFLFSSNKEKLHHLDVLTVLQLQTKIDVAHTFNYKNQYTVQSHGAS